MPYIFRNKRKPGVYQITNLVNGKRYIGSSKNTAQRLLVHRSYLRHSKHENVHLQNAWNKYGEDSFDFKVIMYCEVNQLQTYESYLIRKTKPEYNKAMTFEKYNGVPWTQERKQKMSLWAKNRIMSPEHCKAISSAKSGERHHLCRLKDTEISELMKVYENSEQSQRKISSAWKISQPYLSRLIRGERRAIRS